VAAKALIGVLPDGMALPDRLSGREVLLYLGLLRGMPRKIVTERADELLRVLELDGAEGTAVVDYSTGMRKKITLATALLHNPRLLLLDEPFEAVDPVSAATVRTILQRFVAGGGSVIFSSHVMALVERLCDHVAVIAKGQVVASGPLDEVRGGQSLDDAFVHIVGARLLGWVTGPLLTGDDAALRMDYFKLLPIPPRKLAFAMLGAAFANVSLVFSLIAFAALIALGAQSGAAAALAGSVAVLLELVLAVVASTVAIAVFGPTVSSTPTGYMNRSCRRHRSAR
jgi:hypothetical protein